MLPSSYGASVIFRGLRDGTDFDYEMQMAGMNGAMAPLCQTVFVAASPQVRHIAANFGAPDCGYGRRRVPVRLGGGGYVGWHTKGRRKAFRSGWSRALPRHAQEQCCSLRHGYNREAPMQCDLRGWLMELVRDI